MRLEETTAPRRLAAIKERYSPENLLQVSHSSLGIHTDIRLDDLEWLISKVVIAEDLVNILERVKYVYEFFSDEESTRDLKDLNSAISRFKK